MRENNARLCDGSRGCTQMYVVSLKSQSPSGEKNDILSFDGEETAPFLLGLQRTLGASE